MKAVVVGLPERDAFALSLLMEKMQPGWECRAMPPHERPPAGDLYVLDAEAWYARHGRAEAAARLQAVSGGRPAVIVTAPLPAREEARARATQDAADWERRGWIVVRRPFGVQAMRNALERAMGRCGRNARAHARLPTKPKAPTLPPSRKTPASAPAATVFSLSAFGITQAPPAPRAQPAPVQPAIGEGRLSLDAFAACIESSPCPSCRAGLRKLLTQLRAGTAVELSLTLVNGLVFHPGEGWAASNTPLPVLRMVCRSRALIRHVALNPLPADIDARLRAERRGMTLHPLDEMLHVLARLADCRLPE